MLAASPAYLARAGWPDTPESLANHEVIISPLGVGLGWWTFERDGRTTSVRVHGRLTTSVNQAHGALQLRRDIMVAKRGRNAAGTYLCVRNGPSSLASASVFKRRERLEGVLRCANDNETPIHLPC